MCEGHTVQMVQKAETPIMIGNVPHAGTVSHSCSLIEKHGPPTCKCICGYEWITNEKRLM